MELCLKKLSINDLKESIILEDGILYMDYTASGLGSKLVENKIYQILKTYANTHSELAYNSEKTTYYYNEARKLLKQNLELDDSFCILPVGNGSTGAIKKFQELLGIYIPPYTRKRYNINPSNIPLVIIGPFEHHSNEISWREGLCEVIRCPIGKDGSIDLYYLEKILRENKEREIIGSFSAVSNVTGIKNPIKKIYKLIKKYNGIMCVDNASGSAYFNIDCNYFDALFLSPHKLIGGPGSCGLLVIKKELGNKCFTPTFAGGGVVEYVSKSEQIYIKDIEIREDVGTPGILQFIRASLSYDIRNKIGLDFIFDKEKELNEYFIALIKSIKGIKIYGIESESRCPIYSFNINGFSPYYLSDKLSKLYKIQTRAGCSCAGPYGHDILGIEDGDVDLKNKPGWLRIGLHYVHEKKDIDYFIKSLKTICNNKKGAK